MLAASLPLLAVCSFAGLVSLVQRLRRSVGEKRQQAKWVVWGAICSVLPFSRSVGSWDPRVAPTSCSRVAVLPLPLGIAVASLRYRLWDVDLVINRTLVYAVLGALVVAVYVVVVLALGDLLGERTGAPLVATVLVALGAEPARRRVQRFVDHVVRGDRADPYRALVPTGATARGQRGRPVGAEALRGSADAVRHALQLPWVVVEVEGRSVIRPAGPRRPTASGCRSCTPAPSSGTLKVGPRHVGRALSAR